MLAAKKAIPHCGIFRLSMATLSPFLITFYLMVIQFFFEFLNISANIAIHQNLTRYF